MTRIDELTVVIADDEALARRRISGLLRRHAGVRVLGQFATGPETLAAVRELNPDILFLDVQMPGFGGFEVLNRLDEHERPAVIFSTAYDEYALVAFEVNAVDYLLKPYADERFDASLRRAAQALRGERAAEAQERLRTLLDHVASEVPDGGHRARTTYLERFAVPVRGRVMIVEAADVDWIEASGDYVTLHAGERTHLVRATMGSIERRLDPGRFRRIHRSAIVRLDRVRLVHPDAHGDHLLELADGTRLRLGRRYREGVLERLGMR